jgi:hypothetical protein
MSLPEIRKDDVVLMKLGQAPILARVEEPRLPGREQLIVDRLTDGHLGGNRYRAYDLDLIEAVYRRVEA